MSICITTGFKNIGRGNWDAFNRSLDTYFQGFNALARTCPYPLVAYLEKDCIDKVVANTAGVITLPMEDLDLLVYSHSEKDWEVMNSPEYKLLMKGCRHGESHPERSKKDYNMVTASKTNMIANTKKICPGFDWYAWQDFGNVNLDGGLPTIVDRTKLSKDKITVHGKYHNPCVLPKVDPIGFARTGGAPYICSAQFIVPAQLVDDLDGWMREKVDKYHSINLTDDDQSLLTCIMGDHPEAFEWVGLGDGWYDLWKHYRVK